ncbi:MAG: Cilia- and flagella-associated protein 57 [Paramarteilia canceri]
MKITFFSYYSVFKYITHKKKISHLCCSIKKPYFATCSEDNIIRIWNYKTKSMDLVYKYENEDVTNIDLHPNGLYLALSTLNRLKIYSITIDFLKEIKEIQVRGSTEIKFSQNGQYFAVASGSQIFIFSFISFNRLSILSSRGESVNCLKWTDFDGCLSVGTSKGSFIEWRLTAGATNIKPEAPTSFSLTDSENTEIIGFDYLTEEILQTNENGDIVRESKRITYIISSQNELVEFTDGKIRKQTSLGRDKAKIIITNRLSQTVYIGCTNGLVYRINKGRPILMAKGEIDALCLSKCGRFLAITASLQYFALWKVGSWAESGEIEREWSDDILVTKNDIERLKIRLSELSNKKSEIEIEKEYQIKLVDKKYSDEIENLKNERNSIVETMEKEIAQARNELDTTTNKYKTEILKLKKDFSTRFDAIDITHSKQIALELEKQQKTILKSEKNISDLKEELDKKEKQYQELDKSLTLSAAQERENNVKYQTEIVSNYESKIEEHEKMLKLIESERENEICTLKNEFSSKIKMEEENALK